MTTLISWTSYQNGKPIALTFASDSRFTWGSPKSYWDGGRKIYWCRQSPDIFGYSGDVVTQSTLVSQLCDLIDYSTIVAEGASGWQRHETYVKLMESSIASQVNVPKLKMTTFHGLRENDGSNFSFRLWRTVFSPEGKLVEDRELNFSPNVLKTNGVDDPNDAFAAGTGAGEFRTRLMENKEKYGNTSRAVFRSLLEAKESDTSSGGAPQLVRLGADGFPGPVGIVVGGERSLCGMSLGTLGRGGTIEWRDEDFKFLKGSSLDSKSNAPGYFYW